MSPRFHLPSAVAGAASASAALILLFGRPKDPTFHLISITLSSFSLNLPLLDLDLIRPKPSRAPTPTLVPIPLRPARLSISYRRFPTSAPPLPAALSPPLLPASSGSAARLDGNPDGPPRGVHTS
ncbi:uncharacterized protein A4U43_C04F8460 [Asparagus officinalis]|uniref:Uncharacterized protein n=1 Tax=Asparagus officinalis TaxID=4686 RepID=A0A5P1F1Z0_ASPOF|nr:uncharacterized protein A4U43_C04F8460 [Asparagus officinalis]